MKSKSVSVSTRKKMLIEEFKSTDIGNPSMKGSTKLTEFGFDVTSGGADIWDMRDEFRFVYVEREGDFDICARLESLSAAHLCTKAGIMAREDLSDDGRHIYFQVFPDNSPRNKNNGGYEFQFRLQRGGEMKAIYPEFHTGTPAFPVGFPKTWIRLARRGDRFTGYFSKDGIDWRIYTTLATQLPTKLALGLAVTSHDTNSTTEAKFRDIAEIMI